MLGRTNAITKKSGNGDTNQFDLSNLVVLGGTLETTSKEKIILSGQGGEQLSASYPISFNKGKVLIFRCKFNSDENTAKIIIQGTNNPENASLTTILLNVDEVTDAGTVDLCIPITYDYFIVLFQGTASTRTKKYAYFNEIYLNVSDKELSYIPSDTFDSDVLEGKKYFGPGGLSTGSMINRGAASKTITPSTSAQSYAISEGYHNGNGKVNVSAVPTQTKTVTMTNAEQKVVPDNGKFLSEVTVPSLVCKGVYKDIFQGANITSITDRPIFDSGNSNKKGVFLVIENISSGLVLASNDKTTWTNILDISLAQTEPKVGVTSNRSYRYFYAKFVGYANKNAVIAWGVFDSQ